MATLTCPTCRTPFQQGDLICLTCGANLARVRGGARGEEAVRPPQQIPPAQPPQAPPAQQPQQQYPPPLQQPGPPYPPQHQAEPYAPAGPQGAPPQPPYEPQQPQPFYEQQPPGPPQYDQPMPYQPASYEAPPLHYDAPAQYEAPPHYEPSPAQQTPAQQPYGGQPGFNQPPPYEPTFDPPPAPPYEQQPYNPGFGPQDAPPRVGPPMAPRPAREETLLPPEGGGHRKKGPAAESTAAMCPYCEAVLANPAAAQCDNCLRPLSHQPPPLQQPPAPTPPVLRLQFPTGELQLQPGQHLVLGRDAGQSPVAGTFTQYDNVSRRHTTVWLDQSGTAWCRDERSTNGTFVNGERLPAGVEAPLRDGDMLRLAADVTGTVRLG